MGVQSGRGRRRTPPCQVPPRARTHASRSLRTPGPGRGGGAGKDQSNLARAPPRAPRLGTACPASDVPPSGSQVGSAPVYSGVVLSRRQIDPRLRWGSAVPLGSSRSAPSASPGAAAAPLPSPGTRTLGVCAPPDPTREMSTPARRRLMRDFKR